MFTGIVLEIGTVQEVRHEEAGSRLAISMPATAAEVGLGDSVAIDGCCLTAVETGAEIVVFEAMGETLRRTTVGDLAPDDRVNVELALRVDGRFGGHVVQGHVDGVGEVVGTRPDGIALVVGIACPPAVHRYVVEKGSIAVAGVSLTVSAVTDDGLEIWLIPHTREVTTLGSLAPGSRVNLEADLFAKYVERLVGARS